MLLLIDTTGNHESENEPETENVEENEFDIHVINKFGFNRILSNKSKAVSRDYKFVDIPRACETIAKSKNFRKQAWQLEGACRVLQKQTEDLLKDVTVLQKHLNIGERIAQGKVELRNDIPLVKQRDRVTLPEHCNEPDESDGLSLLIDTAFEIETELFTVDDNEVTLSPPYEDNVKITLPLDQPSKNRSLDESFEEFGGPNSISFVEAESILNSMELDGMGLEGDIEPPLVQDPRVDCSENHPDPLGDHPPNNHPGPSEPSEDPLKDVYRTEEEIKTVTAKNASKRRKRVKKLIIDDAKELSDEEMEDGTRDWEQLVLKLDQVTGDEPYLQAIKKDSKVLDTIPVDKYVYNSPIRRLWKFNLMEGLTARPCAAVDAVDNSTPVVLVDDDIVPPLKDIIISLEGNVELPPLGDYLEPIQEVDESQEKTVEFDLVSGRGDGRRLSDEEDKPSMRDLIIDIISRQLCVTFKQLLAKLNSNGFPRSRRTAALAIGCVLELAKNGYVTVKQHGSFKEIIIRKND